MIRKKTVKSTNDKQNTNPIVISHLETDNEVIDKLANEPSTVTPSSSSTTTTTSTDSQKTNIAFKSIVSISPPISTSLLSTNNSSKSNLSVKTKDKLTVNSIKKVKGDKLPGPPPFEYPTIDRFEVTTINHIYFHLIFS